MFNGKIICTYLYTITKYGYPPAAELTPKYLKEMSDLGFKSVELEGIREDHLQKVYDIKGEVFDQQKKLALSIPYFCAVLPGLTSVDKKEREKQLLLFEKGCETAKLFGSLGILDNAPLPPYLFPENIPIVRHYHEDILASAKLPDGLSWEKFWEYATSTYRDACDIASHFGLTYQMHPSIGVLASNADDFLRFFESVNRNNLRFNFDTANQFVMKEELSNSLNKLKDHIDYIHLSDNRGKKVEHLPAGKGIINWDIFFETLDKIDFKGHIGLDIGGAETEIDNLDEAYISTADWLEQNWSSKK